MPHGGSVVLSFNVSTSTVTIVACTHKTSHLISSEVRVRPITLLLLCCVSVTESVHRLSDKPSTFSMWLLSMNCASDVTSFIVLSLKFKLLCSSLTFLQNMQLNSSSNEQTIYT